MPDKILRDITHLASTLANEAGKQIDTLSAELKGEVGTARDAGAPHRVNVGTMAFNVLQLASKVGDLLKQLSEYDLVRRDVPTLALRSSNPLSSLALQAGQPLEYDLFLENDGITEQQVALQAELINQKTDEHLYLVNLSPKAPLTLFASERRHVHVSGPTLPSGKYFLNFTIKDGHGTALSKKVVELDVRPHPTQHDHA